MSHDAETEGYNDREYREGPGANGRSGCERNQYHNDRAVQHCDALFLSIVPHAPRADLHITGLNPQHPAFGSGAIAMVNFLTIRRDQNADEARLAPDRMRNYSPVTSTRQQLDKEKFFTDSIKTLADEERREGLYHE
ncbi:hypothetical protein [Rhizobium sp. 1399]|uniref:hypothetical protein n=1 Tax=Rhizobium sp. 1399 TaxID=2817758 RepID=UPI00285C3B34|nr:hypothetical protein [Rhizobium sp. 1399]MDR6668680.1 hypothetical protein [Rhizobium sp. 1399]